MGASLPDLQTSDGIPLIKGRVCSHDKSSVELAIPGSNYRLHFAVSGCTFETGTMVTGIGRCHSQRIDTTKTGGHFIEPCYGRPRRIQGRIVGGSAARNEIYVKATVPFIVTPMAPQKASDFAIGELIMFDAKEGTSFEPAPPSIESNE